MIQKFSRLVWFALALAVVAALASWAYSPESGRKTVWVAPVVSVLPSQPAAPASPQPSGNPHAPAPSTSPSPVDLQGTLTSELGGPSAIDELEAMSESLRPEDVAAAAATGNSLGIVVGTASPAAAAVKNKFRVAIVLDDVGKDPALVEQLLTLPAGVTFSLTPATPGAADLAAKAKAAGHEVLLGVPMEPMGGQDPGPDALMTSHSIEEIRARLDKVFGSFTGYDGVNNYMGSKFTADRPKMLIVIGALKEKSLFFFEWKTTVKSVAANVARELKLPSASRDVYLGDGASTAFVKSKLAEAAKMAQKRGAAIVNGHAYPALIKAIEEWLPDAEKQGLDIVPVRELVK